LSENRVLRESEKREREREKEKEKERGRRKEREREILDRCPKFLPYYSQ
jgi:hypothetical protein